jgi:uncharacterized protein YeaO (DUF488 family)
MGTLRIKRIYEDLADDDGWRVLVDRLWPRGVKKDAAHLDLWAKEVTPSPDLRRAFHSGDLSFGDFSNAYRAELDANPDAVSFAEACASHLEQGNVTLLYAAKSSNNHAGVLLDWVISQLEERG